MKHATKLRRVSTLARCQRTPGSYWFPPMAVLLALGLAMGPLPAMGAWDPSQPAASSSLSSGPVRDNFKAVESSVLAVNQVRNGDLWYWAAGGSAAPDNFTLTGGSCTIARTGTGMADTFSFGTGRFAAKVTRAGTNCVLTYTAISTTDMADATRVKGKRWHATMLAKSSTASHVRITIDDGVGTTSSLYHTGGGTAEFLVASRTLDAAATKIEVKAEVNATDAAAYVGGFITAQGDVPPSEWFYSPSAVTFAAPPTGVPTFSRTTSAFTKNNNTTFGDVTGMAFSVGANEVWVFSFHMFYTSPTAAGYKITLTGPASPTAVQYAIEVSTLTDATAFGTTVVGASVDSIDQLRVISGILRNGANAGTVQLQFAQNVATVADSIVRADSFVTAWRIQ